MIPRYGFATVGNLMRLSLIRAPKAPDPNADIGRHSFRYAILPHSGPVDETVIRTARDFNNTLRAAFVTGKQHLKLSSAIRVEGASGIILDAVK